MFKSYTGLCALLKPQEKAISPKEKNKKPLGEFYLRHIKKNKSQQNNTPNRQKHVKSNLTSSMEILT